MELLSKIKKKEKRNGSIERCHFSLLHNLNKLFKGHQLCKNFSGRLQKWTYSVWFIMLVVDDGAGLHGLAVRGAGQRSCAALEFADGGKKLLRKLGQVCNRKEKKQSRLLQQRHQAGPEECVSIFMCVCSCFGSFLG